MMDVLGVGVSYQILSYLMEMNRLLLVRDAKYNRGCDMACLNCDRRVVGCHAQCKDFDEPKRMATYVGFGQKSDINAPYHDYLHMKVTHKIRDKCHGRG